MKLLVLYMYETLGALYKCKTEELFDDDQIVIKNIVYIKFVIEKRGIDDLNAMVRISLDGGQNFLKVIVNLIDPNNHYSSSEIYEDLQRCHILAIVELVSEEKWKSPKTIKTS